MEILVYTVVLAVACVLLSAAGGVIRRNGRFEFFAFVEEFGERITAAGVWLEENVVTMFAVGIGLFVAGTAYRGAICIGYDKALTALLALSCVGTAFTVHRRLARQPSDQNSILLLAILLPFAAISACFSAIGVYKIAVAPDPVAVERGLFAKYYSEVQSSISERIELYQGLAREHAVTVAAALAEFQNVRFMARQDGTPFVPTPAQLLLPGADQAARTWAGTAGALVPPPLVHPNDRTEAADGLQAAVTALNRVALMAPTGVQSPPPLQIKEYVPQPTDILSYFAAKLSTRDLAACFCVGISIVCEFLGLLALSTRRRKVPFELRVKSWREKFIAVWSELKGIRRETGRADTPPTKDEQVTVAAATRLNVTFVPEVHESVTVECPPGENMDLLPAGAVLERLRRALDPLLKGHAITGFVSRDEKQLDTAAPILAQLPGATLTALVARISTTD